LELAQNRATPVNGLQVAANGVTHVWAGDLVVDGLKARAMNHDDESEIPWSKKDQAFHVGRTGTAITSRAGSALTKERPTSAWISKASNSALTRPSKPPDFQRSHRARDKWATAVLNTVTVPGVWSVEASFACRVAFVLILRDAVLMRSKPHKPLNPNLKTKNVKQQAKD